MLEKDLEKEFVRRVSERGGKAYKWVSPGSTGVPDRIVILPGNKIGFVELKVPGKYLRADQRRQAAVLSALGCLVYVVHTPEEIPVVLQAIVDGMPLDKLTMRRLVRGGDAT